MTVVLQRVLNANVEINGIITGKCGYGYVILLGVFSGDDICDARDLAEKVVKLRVFGDSAGKMNLSIADISGSVLIISQFTLCADYSHGNRPDFLSAADPVTAKKLYDYFISEMKTRIGEDKVESGIFGADMKVSLINDGPVTIIMESDVLKK